jgi:hypothetical protein
VLKLLMELNMHGGPLYTLVYASQLAFWSKNYGMLIYGWRQCIDDFVTQIC